MFSWLYAMSPLWSLVSPLETPKKQGPKRQPLELFSRQWKCLQTERSWAEPNQSKPVETCHIIQSQLVSGQQQWLKSFSANDTNGDIRYTCTAPLCWSLSDILLCSKHSSPICWGRRDRVGIESLTRRLLPSLLCEWDAGSHWRTVSKSMGFHHLALLLPLNLLPLPILFI